MFNECAIYWSVIVDTLLHIMVDLVVVIDAGSRLLFVTMLKITNFTFYAESGEHITKNSVCIFVKHIEHYLFLVLKPSCVELCHYAMKL